LVPHLVFIYRHESSLWSRKECRK